MELVRNLHVVVILVDLLFAITVAKLLLLVWSAGDLGYVNYQFHMLMLELLMSWIGSKLIW